MDASETAIGGAANAAQPIQGAPNPPSCNRSSEYYDIAIVGLGPAGATVARLLDPQFSVIAFDRKTLERTDPLAEGGFRKPCGGLLAPDAQRALASFDMAMPKDILVDPQIFSVRVLDLASGITRYYQRCYINIDRHRFDQWLMAQIPDTVDAKLGSTVLRVARNGEEGGFTIEYRDADGGMRTATASAVIGADGAFSQVRQLLYPNSHLRAYISIQQWFRDEHPSPFYSCIFDPDATDCCSWSISKDGYFVFGGAYPVQGACDAFERQKAKLSRCGFIFGEPLRTEACQVLRPEGMRSVRCGHDGGFLIGEAAGFISASSLEGISFALESARMLADVLNAKGLDKRANRRYRAATASLRLKVQAKVLKSRVIDNPALRGAVMRLGLRSIDVAETDR